MSNSFVTFSVGITATESFELQHYSRSDSNSQPSATALTTTSPLTQLTTVKREGLMAQSLLVGIAHTTEDIEMNTKPTGKANSKLQRSSSERIKVSATVVRRGQLSSDLIYSSGFPSYRIRRRRLCGGSTI